MKKYKQTFDSLLEKITDNKIIRIRLDELNFHPELEQAFKINEDVKKRIEDDVRVNGNNTKAHPIHIFKMDGKWYVSDGHTRVTVLRELNYTHAWAQVHVFASISEALCHTMSEQFNRRNESDAILMAKYLALREEVQNGKKLSADEMAKKLNKSRRFVFVLQSVFAKSSKQQLQAIKDGTATINSVYQELKRQEAKDSSESHEPAVTAGSVAPAVPLEPAAESEVPSEPLKTISPAVPAEHVKSAAPTEAAEPSARYLTDKQFFMLGAKYAFLQAAKGKTSQQVLNALKTLPDTLTKEALEALKEAE